MASWSPSGGWPVSSDPFQLIHVDVNRWADISFNFFSFYKNKSKGTQDLVGSEPSALLPAHTHGKMVTLMQTDVASLLQMEGAATRPPSSPNSVCSLLLIYSYFRKCVDEIQSICWPVKMIVDVVKKLQRLTMLFINDWVDVFLFFPLHSRQINPLFTRNCSYFTRSCCDMNRKDLNVFTLLRVLTSWGLISLPLFTL